MTKELICLASVGALFYPREEPGDGKYAGYIRIKVSEPVRGRTGKSMPTNPHRYFPLLFIHSTWEKGEKKGKKKGEEKEEEKGKGKGELYFNPEQAFAARREEFAGSSDQRREWKRFSLDSLNVPAREKEKLETLYVKLEHSLERIVRGLSPLGEDSASRRTFLACYPSQLREGVDLSQAYGAAANNALRLSLCQQDMPSYDGGKVVNKTLPFRKIKEYHWFR